jgi:hypothetical protein
MSDYTISPARYAKGKVVVCCPSTDGYKTRAAYLATAKGIGGKYVGRSGGYTMSPSAAKKFKRLYEEGWNAYADGRLIPPRDALPLLSSSLENGSNP